MKLFIASLSTLITIHAQERKFSHITSMAWTQIQSKTSITSKELSKRVQNYGCHCFPGLSKIAGGAGPAQDDYDELCRSWLDATSALKLTTVTLSTRTRTSTDGMC